MAKPQSHPVPRRTSAPIPPPPVRRPPRPAVSHPVFQGFAESGISARVLAALAGVSTTTAGRWRRGETPVAPEIVAFLTRVLASWLAELEETRRLEATWNITTRNPRLNLHAQITAGLRCLRLQEAFNTTLPPDALKEGVALFRAWWRDSGGRLGDFHFLRDTGRTPSSASSQVSTSPSASEAA